MKTIKTIAVLLCSIFAGNYLYGQEVLTLQKAVKFALENKAEAKKSKLELENAQYQIDEVRSGALPQITASGSLKYNAIIPEMAIDLGGEVITAKMGQPWNSAGMVSLNQQLFNQSLFTGLKAAKTTKEFYQINVQLTEEQLIEKVSNSYYDIFQTQLQLETIQANLDNTIKTKNVVDGLVQAGLQKKIDLDRLMVAINNLESQKQQVLNELQLKENALKFAIGMPIEMDVELPKETFDIDASIVLESSDVSMRTEVLLSEKQIELYELNKTSKVADLYPKLSLGADFGFNGFGQGFPIGGDFMWPKTSSIGLNLSIPIFSGGFTRSKINQADIQIRQARVDLEDTKLGLSLANENAKSQIKNSLLVVNSNRSNVSLAKEVLSDTENNYKNGLANLTELLDAEKAFADAQNNLNTSLLNFKVAEIQLIKAKGNLKSLVNE
ncbi:TolC family protein [Sphingobacterium pedocola]|uniref:Transporter n=1 Tax=Sphingobacterium pedocola TaxID=2082722 RepID=A0ABR9TAN5_9SPHI|nr:TolC family protein [Sphingobacterium pedocola]MBE8722384.1 transporter [Sphingobacterium pedocola]